MKSSVKSYGQKKNGVLEVPDVQVEAENDWLASLKDGTIVVREHRIFRRGKTHNQLGAQFGLLIKTAVQDLEDRGEGTEIFFNSPDPSGVKIDEDMLKNYFYIRCPIYNDKGNRITLSKADTTQASKHFSDCQNILASRPFSIFIPDPDKNWREKL